MKLIKLLSLVIVILVVTSVTLSNHSLDDSDKVKDLTLEINSLEKNNAIVRDKISTQGSLAKLAIELQNQGYVPAQTIETLAIPGNVASR